VVGGERDKKFKLGKKLPIKREGHTAPFSRKKSTGEKALLIGLERVYEQQKQRKRRTGPPTQNEVKGGDNADARENGDPFLDNAVVRRGRRGAITLRILECLEEEFKRDTGNQVVEKSWPADEGAKRTLWDKDPWEVMTSWAGRPDWAVTIEGIRGAEGEQKA